MFRRLLRISKTEDQQADGNRLTI